jgi:hypothetical protein
MSMTFWLTKINNKKWVILAAVVVCLMLFYLTYFVLRYIPFSLTVDRQSVAIGELVLRNMKESNGVLGVSLPPPGPNRTPGCSFLLLEEIWRDCKSVFLIVDRGSVKYQDIGKIEGVFRQIAASPCDFVGSDRKLANEIGCSGGVPRDFHVSLFMVNDRARYHLTTIKGRIK